MADDTKASHRPNWRDPSSYDYTQNLTREGWSWEFLRRNPKYRGTWLDRKQTPPRDPTKRSQARTADSAETRADPAVWGLVGFCGSGPHGARSRDPLAP